MKDNDIAKYALEAVRLIGIGSKKNEKIENELKLATEGKTISYVFFLSSLFIFCTCVLTNDMISMMGVKEISRLEYKNFKFCSFMLSFFSCGMGIIIMSASRSSKSKIKRINKSIATNNQQLSTLLSIIGLGSMKIEQNSYDSILSQINIIVANLSHTSKTQIKKNNQS